MTNEKATDLAHDFISNIQHARERMLEIGAHLDEHLGFAPDEITSDAVGIAEALLAKLDDAMTIAEQVDDLNQALHQADKDNPARDATGQTADEYIEFLNS